MKIRPLFAAMVFLGSYFPLALILLAQDYRFDLLGNPTCMDIWKDDCILPLKQPGLSLAFVSISLACFAFAAFIVQIMRTQQVLRMTEVKHVPADLMNYVLPYVVSFMGIDYSDSGKFLGFFVFMVWMFLIIYKSQRVIMNPALTVFGWKLYEIKYTFPAGQTQHTSLALSRLDILAGYDYSSNSIQDVIVLK